MSNEIVSANDDSNETMRGGLEAEGIVTIYRSTARRSGTGGWKAGKILLWSEGFAALAATAVEANMVVFLNLVLRQNNAKAAKSFSAWNGFLNLSTLIGAFLSDSCLGRFRTCAISQAALFIGLFVLSMSTQLVMLEPKGCGKFDQPCGEPSTTKVVCFYMSIYLLALGSGALEPALATMGADQFDETDPEEMKSKSSFFSYYYIALDIGSLVAETTLVYLENLGKWAMAFWISSLSGFVGLAFLLCGSRSFRHSKTAGNPMSRFAQVIVASIRKYKADVPLRGQGLYEVNATDSIDRLIHKDDMKFLDKAAVIIPSDISNEGQSPNPWRLCTITQVEEVKSFLRLIPMWLCTVVVSIVFVQESSPFVEQGAAMDQHLSNFHMPPSSMTVFDVISTAAFILSYQKVLAPLYTKLTKRKLRALNEIWRMAIGMFVAIIAVIVAGIVEQQRLKQVSGVGRSELSIFWQVPQYLLTGASKALVSIAQMEFFAAQVPKTMQSLGLGLSMAVPAVGSYLFTAMVSLVSKITSKDGKQGWIPPDLNDGHLDRFFFLSAALIGVSLLLFILSARRFKPITIGKKEDELEERLEEELEVELQ